MVSVGSGTDFAGLPPASTRLDVTVFVGDRLAPPVNLARNQLIERQLFGASSSTRDACNLRRLTLEVARFRHPHVFPVRRVVRRVPQVGGNPQAFPLGAVRSAGNGSPGHPTHDAAAQTLQRVGAATSDGYSETVAFSSHMGRNPAAVSRDASASSTSTGSAPMSLSFHAWAITFRAPHVITTFTPSGSAPSSRP